MDGFTAAPNENPRSPARVLALYEAPDLGTRYYF